MGFFLFPVQPPGDFAVRSEVALWFRWTFLLRIDKGVPRMSRQAGGMPQTNLCTLVPRHRPGGATATTTKKVLPLFVNRFFFFVGGKICICFVYFMAAAIGIVLAAVTGVLPSYRQPGRT